MITEIDDYSYLLISLTFLIIIITYVKLNSLSFLDKMSRTELNRFQDAKSKGDVRLLKCLLAIVLSTAFYVTGFPYAGLVNGASIVLVWYQCYDIFKGISWVEYKATKDWVTREARFKTKLESFMKTMESKL